ncbi:MAG: hypothetical protein ACOYOA_06900 [Saprospiraceae bacterium]
MKDNLKKELEEISPYLSEMKDKPEGYQVPKDYFAGLQDSVFAQLKNEQAEVFVKASQETATQKTSIWQNILAEIAWIIRPRYAVAMASLVALLFFAWLQFRPSTDDNCTQLACVSDSEIQQYLEQNLDEIDTETLWSAAATENINANEAQSYPDAQQLDSKNLKIKEASENEVNQLLQEMIDSGELSEEDIKGII